MKEYALNNTDSNDMNSESFRVSIMIGVYNSSSTILEALDSLYNQTFQGFRIIICDDGSSDNTYDIVLQQSKKHNNIILLKNERNMGLNYTLNKCLEYADTEYVARMDGDDISLPKRLEIELAFLDEHPEYAFVSSTMIHFDERGDFKIGHAIESPTPNHFVHGSPFNHAASMSRTSIIKQVNGYSVDPRLLRVEDYHLWVKLYSAGYRGYNIQEPLYKMRDDRNALRRRNWQNRKNEIYVRHIGFKLLGLPWYMQIFALRPLLAYLVPGFVYNLYHKR